MIKRKISRSSYWFTSPSFLTGAGSVLNISGNYYRFDFSNSGMQADSNAIKSDWCLVGRDIERAANGSNTQAKELFR
jgi:hypothetical protein